MGGLTIRELEVEDYYMHTLNSLKFYEFGVKVMIILFLITCLLSCLLNTVIRN